MRRLKRIIGITVAIIAILLVVDYFNFHAKERRAMEAVHKCGGRCGSLMDWPFGREYQVIFARPLTESELDSLDPLNSLRGYVGVHFKCELSKEQLQLIETKLHNCKIYNNLVSNNTKTAAPQDSPTESKEMNIDRFWEILHNARLSDLPDNEEWDARLEETLSQLSADEIVAWNHIFDQLAADAYTIDLWGAAYIINGGASDDGFYYFRCWLIGMGKEAYEAALASPDSLADVVTMDVDAEAEIYAAAHQAWMKVTGKSDLDPYPARNEKAELKGEDWDFDDPAECRKRLPRLSEMYLE